MAKVARLSAAISLVLFLCLGAVAFAGGTSEQGGTSGPVTVNVAFPNNPISQALAKLTAEKYKAENVTVNLAVLPENDLRQKLTTEASTGGTSYDIFVIGPYETQTWAKNKCGSRTWSPTSRPFPRTSWPGTIAPIRSRG